MRSEESSLQKWPEVSHETEAPFQHREGERERERERKRDAQRERGRTEQIERARESHVFVHVYMYMCAYIETGCASAESVDWLPAKTAT